MNASRRPSQIPLGTDKGSRQSFCFCMGPVMPAADAFQKPNNMNEIDEDALQRREIYIRGTRAPVTEALPLVVIVLQENI